MSEYCTNQQVIDRLTEAGVKHLADRDRSGRVSTAEATATIGTAVTKAGNAIDFAIVSFCPPATARAQASAGTVGWLTDRAVEIACYEACTIGGASAPESVQSAFDRATLQLLDVRRDQGVVPGLVIPPPHNSCGHAGVRVVNPR